jgi:Ca-activated chloride channel family protein
VSAVRPNATKLALLPLLAALLHASAAAQTQSPTPTPAPGPRPLTYGLVVDNSGSVRADLSRVIGAAKVFVAGNAAEDETFVVRFVSSDNIEVLRDFTRDKAALSRALDDMYVEGGQTAIVDALYVSAEHLSKRAAGADASRRRALVLLTDGEDRASFYRAEKLIQFLREQQIRVFVLGFPEEVKHLPNGAKGYPMAVALLKRLAQETGGQAVLVENVAELKTAAGELLKHLRDE